MNDTVVAIVSAFFVIGILAGIVTVVAMSVLRAGRRGDPGDSGGPPDDDSGGPPDDEPGGPRSGPRWDDAGPDDHPRWPGGADNDFYGR
jgi:hypothetical protein